MTASRTVDAFVAVPDPGQAGSLDELTDGLRALKVWAGDPSYERITGKVNEAWTAAGRPAGELTSRATVVDCFKPGRRRLNTDLVIAIVHALHPDPGYVTQWRQALQVVSGNARAAAQVRVQDLPQDLGGFTGRAAELDQIGEALRPGNVGGAAVICVIEGMAGVGKTTLAVHAGHHLSRDRSFDRVLFVNLRGFHPDPAQPPADPAAVLDGFLRLLGMPGHQIPHDLPARIAAYRALLADVRSLVVLDNAADAGQVRPLIPQTPGSAALVTSRRDLTDLHPDVHLNLEVFDPSEARQFLIRAAPAVPEGEDFSARNRIAHRCGYLPLALGLVAGQIWAKPGWTLTDHADRLDERHRSRRLDTAVELALDLSCRHLPSDRQRLLRLAALHPGQDFDAYAGAALTDSDLDTAQHHLDLLHRDHLLQQTATGRYTFHDLVRDYAMGWGSEEDRPPDRRAAMIRLFDYYLATAATAMNALYPAEAHYRPRIPPAATSAPGLGSPDTGRAWLDTERPVLVTIAVYTANHGQPTYTTQLSTILYRFLDGGYHADALSVHSHARKAAQLASDTIGQAHALTSLGATNLQLGRYGQATGHLQQALTLYQQIGDRIGQARVLTHLGTVEHRLGYCQPTDIQNERVPPSVQQNGDPTGYHDGLAAEHFAHALALFQQARDRSGEADALDSLGYAEVRLGRYGPATEHLERALSLYRHAGDRDGQAWVLDSLGVLRTQLGRPTAAAEHHELALTIFREVGVRSGEAWALNGLGEAAHAAGRPADALGHHTTAAVVAAGTGDRHQHARAHIGLGHAHRALGDPGRAHQHYQHARALYADLDAQPTKDRRTDPGTDADADAVRGSATAARPRRPGSPR